MLKFPHIRVDRHPNTRGYYTIFVIKCGEEFYYNRSLYKDRARRVAVKVAKADKSVEHYRASDYWRRAPNRSHEQLLLIE